MAFSITSIERKMLFRFLSSRIAKIMPIAVAKIAMLIKIIAFSIVFVLKLCNKDTKVSPRFDKCEEIFLFFNTRRKSKKMLYICFKI